MPTYAKTTTVSVEKSKAEIERALKRWGATAFMFAWEGDRNLVAFKYSGLEARIPIPMPDRYSDEVVRTPVTRETRTRDAQERAYDQALRQRWRAMLLIVKAKLEAIEAEITTFEQEFLPFFVLPDGRTVSDAMMPGIYRALEAGQMPPMLPEGQSVK